MADLTVTLMGSIETGLARAAHQSIAIYSRAALLALNDVHFRLGIDYTSSGYSPASEPPTRRWSELINTLIDIDRASWPTPSLRSSLLPGAVPGDFFTPEFTLELRTTLAAASRLSRDAVARLLVEAGTFLVGESVELAAQVELATAVSQTVERAVMIAKLDEVTTAARKLLDLATADALEVFFFGEQEPARAESAVAGTLTNAWDAERAAAALIEDDDYCTPRFVDGAHRDRSIVVLVGAQQSGKTCTAMTLLRARRVLFEKAMSHGMAQEACTAMAVSPSGGVLTDPIQLMPPVRQGDLPPAEPAEWLGAALMQFERQVEALGRNPVSAEYPSCSDPVARWVELVEGLTGFGTVRRPDHVVVLPDETEIQAVPPMTAVAPQDLVALLREDGLIPDLTGTSVTVVRTLSSAQKADLHEHWLAICTAANAQACEFDLAGDEAELDQAAVSSGHDATSSEDSAVRFGPPRESPAVGTVLVMPRENVLTSAGAHSCDVRISRRRSALLPAMGIVQVLMSILIVVFALYQGVQPAGAVLIGAATSWSSVLAFSTAYLRSPDFTKRTRSETSTTAESSRLIHL
ncbi:hypothetical protein [Nocardia sp. NRRL S-836]|uniref:hypothetical protein n=1 Tax=Nocardia sp. NRRL S-836 TaxID=1519492 RepID=UPI0006AE7D73|nr:hypothetical protein [Nocardia sp. NRRL S-836]KOV87587.1 hypothetical protein ADL03_06750 [Nocardia sp. NRRL S-836]